MYNEKIQAENLRLLVPKELTNLYLDLFGQLSTQPEILYQIFVKI